MDRLSPSIPEALRISLFGLCVVFAVLIFLMAVIYAMSAIVRTFIVKSNKAKSDKAKSDKKTAAEAQPAAAATAAIQAVPEIVPEADPVPEARDEPTIMHTGYRLSIAGKAFDVTVEDVRGII